MKFKLIKVLCKLFGHRTNMKIRSKKAKLVCFDCKESFDYIQKV